MINLIANLYRSTFPCVPSNGIEFDSELLKLEFAIFRMSKQVLQEVAEVLYLENYWTRRPFEEQVGAPSSKEARGDMPRFCTSSTA